MLCTGFPYNVREQADFARDFARLRWRRRRSGVTGPQRSIWRMLRVDVSMGSGRMGSVRGTLLPARYLISEAHGTITNFKLERVDIYNEQVLASNGLIHEAMLEVLELKYRSNWSNRTYSADAITGS